MQPVIFTRRNQLLQKNYEKETYFFQKRLFKCKNKCYNAFVRTLCIFMNFSFYLGI